MLVYEIGSGWEPICASLGLPVPEVPFPRGNSSANDALAANIKQLFRS